VEKEKEELGNKESDGDVDKKKEVAEEPQKQVKRTVLDWGKGAKHNDTLRILHLYCNDGVEVEGRNLIRDAKKNKTQWDENHKTHGFTTHLWHIYA